MASSLTDAQSHMFQLNYGKMKSLCHSWCPISGILTRFSASCWNLEEFGWWSIGQRDSVHVNLKEQRIKDTLVPKKYTHFTLLPNLASMWPIHGIGSALSLNLYESLTVTQYQNLRFTRLWSWKIPNNFLD